MSVEITGKINIDGVETEFIFHPDHGSWSQWGGNTEQLGARVDYLDAMARGLFEDTDYYEQDNDGDPGCECGEADSDAEGHGSDHDED